VGLRGLDSKIKVSRICGNTYLKELPVLPLSSHQIHKALRRNILAGSLGTVFGVATTGTFLIGYALRLGASPFQIGLLSSLPLLCFPIQILASYVSERRRERKRTWILVTFAHRLIWIALVFTPFYIMRVSPSAAIGTMLWVLLFSYLLASWGVPLWYSWMADLLPLRMRGRFWGKRQAILNGVAFTCSLLLAKLLDAFPQNGNSEGLIGFSFLIVIGVVFGELDVLIYKKIPEPRMEKETERVGLFELLKRPFRDMNFRRYLLFVSVRNFSVYFMAPFVSVFLLTYLKMTYFEIYLLNSIHIATFILFSRLWGSIVDKVGNRPIKFICLVPLSIHPLFYLLASPSTYMYVLAPLYFTLGIFAAGVTIASVNLLIGLSPTKGRSMFIAMVHSLVGLVASLAPLLSGQIIEWTEGVSFILGGHRFINLHFVFIMAVFLRFLSVYLFSRIKEQGALSVGIVVRQIATASPFRLIPAYVFLRSSHEERRLKAVKALGKKGNLLAEETILSLLQDPSQQVRQEAARALEQIRGRKKN